jgi:hypothetical protein
MVEGRAITRCTYHRILLVCRFGWSEAPVNTIACSQTVRRGFNLPCVFQAAEGGVPLDSTVPPSPP